MNKPVDSTLNIQFPQHVCHISLLLRFPARWSQSLSVSRRNVALPKSEVPSMLCSAAHPVALSLTGHPQTRHRCSLTSHKQPWQSALRWLPSVLLTHSRETEKQQSALRAPSLSSEARHTDRKQPQNTLRTEITPKFKGEECYFQTGHSVWIIYSVSSMLIS